VSARGSEPVTFAGMEQDAARRLVRVRAGAAAFAGLVALTFGDLSSSLVSDAPRALRAAFATVVILSGYCLARTFIAFHNCNEVMGALGPDAKARELPPRQSAGRGDTDTGRREQWPPDGLLSPMPREASRPRTPHEPAERPDQAVGAYQEYRFGRNFYRVSIGLIVVSVLLFLVAVWWSAFIPTPA